MPARVGRSLGYPLGYPLGFTPGANPLWPDPFANDGIHLDFVSGQHYVKAPGQDPTVAPFSSLFTFTGDNQSKYRGGNGLLIPSLTNTPRIEYDANGNVLGLLMEGSRANLLLRSEDFTNGVSWVNTTSTMSTNTVTAPDGTLTADTLVEDNTNTTHFTAQNAIPGTVDNGIYALSVFAQANARGWLNFETRTRDGASFPGAYFNLSGAGAVGTTNAVIAAGITRYVNNWYRCWITCNLLAGASVPYFLIASATADGTRSYLGTTANAINLWGAQYELGAFMSSYIPTTTVAVTRAADGATRAFGAEYNGDGPSTYFEDFDVLGLDGGNSYSMVRGNVNGAHFFMGGAGAARFSDGTNVPTTANVITPNIGSKVASSFDVGGVSICLNSGTIVTSAFDGTFGTGATVDLNVGASGLYRHIRRLDYYPTRLPNAILQALTA